MQTQPWETNVCLLTLNASYKCYEEVIDSLAISSDVRGNVSEYQVVLSRKVGVKNTYNPVYRL